MPFRNHAAIFWLSGTLSVLNLACSPSNSSQSAVKVAVTPTPVAALPDVAPIHNNTPQPSAQEIYEKAMHISDSAQLCNESSVSVEDWQVTLSHLQSPSDL